MASFVVIRWRQEGEQLPIPCNLALRHQHAGSVQDDMQAHVDLLRQLCICSYTNFTVSVYCQTYRICDLLYFLISTISVPGFGELPGPHRLSVDGHNPTCRRLRALTHPSPLSLVPTTLKIQSWASVLLAVSFFGPVVGYILSVMIPRNNRGAPLTGHQYRPSHKPLRKRYVELPIPQHSLAMHG
jgi:hypothetical protein